MAKYVYIGEHFEYLRLKDYWHSYYTGQIDCLEISVLVQDNKKHQGWSLDCFMPNDPVFSG